MRGLSKMLAAGAVATGVIAGALLLGQRATAADHLDPPDRVVAGDPADIGDVYAYTRNVGGVDKLVAVLTFGGPVAPAVDQTGTYADNVIYGLHIDNDGDVSNGAEHNIWIRFGQNAMNMWGYQVTGAPGSSGPLIGQVEFTTVDGDVKAFAGLRDDPFFFDLVGFQDTVGNIAAGAPDADLAFTGADFFAGLNITSIVLEMPVSALLNSGTQDPNIQVWATTGTI